MIPKLRIMDRQTTHSRQRTRHRGALAFGLTLALLAAFVLAPALAAAANPPVIENVGGWGNANDGQSTLQATIDPEGLETTYTLSACEPQAAQCQKTEGTLPADNETHRVSIQLTGLQRGIAYQLDIHAQSSAGETNWTGELMLPTLPPSPCPSGGCPPPPLPEIPPWSRPEGSYSGEPYETTLSQETIEQIAKYGEEAPAREQQRLTKEQEEQQAKEAAEQHATELKHTEEQAAEAAARQREEREEEEAEHPACRVPALKGDTLASARRALRRAHCRLGAIHQPAHHHGTLYVSAQGAPAGEQLAHGARVVLWCGAKGSGAKRASHRGKERP